MNTRWRLISGTAYYGLQEIWILISVDRCFCRKKEPHFCTHASLCFVSDETLFSLFQRKAVLCLSIYSAQPPPCPASEEGVHHLPPPAYCPREDQLALGDELDCGERREDPTVLEGFFSFSFFLVQTRYLI